MNILVNLNLNKNELQNARIQNLAVAPTSGVAGQIYFDTIDNKLKIYDGTSWIPVGTDYTLPIATSSTLGGILAAIKDADDTVEVAVDTNGKLYVPTYPTLVSLGGIAASEKGVANGVASLGADGKVPSSQLPSYVDDVIEGYYYNDKFYSDSEHTSEITPETGKIYVDITSNKSYRWGGTVYFEISAATIHKYVGTITGDGLVSTFTINHGLDSRDVLINIYDSTSNEEIMADIYRSSPTSISVSFAVAPAVGTSYKVVVIA